MQTKADGLYATAMNSPLLQEMREGKVKPVVAKATLVTDKPDKLQAEVGKREADGRYSYGR